MKVSIVLPTLNEEKGIKITLDSINGKEFEKRNWNLEILVVDGGSLDRTREVASLKGARVILEERKGYGRAYKTGFREAKGDIICTGDADGTYPFDELHNYVQLLLDEGLDFITTDRFAGLEKKAMAMHHRIGNKGLSWVLRLLFWIKLKDSQSGMWIFRKSAFEKIQPLEKFNNGMPFSEELKIEMFKAKGIKAREIPSKFYRREGEEKMHFWKDGLRDLGFLFKKRFRLKRKSKTICIIFQIFL
jgi:hypothetical protein